MISRRHGKAEGIDVYQHRYLVGLAGFPDSGRDEVAEVLGNLDDWMQHGFARVGEALLTQIDPMLVDERLPGEFQQFREIPEETRRGLSDYQRILRNLRSHTGLVLDAWETEVRGVYQSLVCPDVDYPAEAAAVYAAGGIVLRIINPAGGSGDGSPAVAGQAGITYHQDPVACAERVLEKIGYVSTRT